MFRNRTPVGAEFPGVKRTIDAFAPPVFVSQLTEPSCPTVHWVPQPTVIENVSVAL